ncbi:hypothetical protein PN36_19335 [Candidatus Thiomargarita nelsonii]|uniref:Uncharacterized protein n=1 Tax=Candidatus Thiomargarita nelsonii TaxID=1003181 RepID=A0A0A6RXE5_9GAMM|nr:hypothetical protein PN36_19335 [Candidatus Thiomargarita nelsonii]
MKRLNRIILINWYLIEGLEIPVKGNIAFVGPNGSGKSSILDAIQTVLTGANKRYLSLNAGAGEHGTRKLWEYCLGYMYDPNEAEIENLRPPRDEAQTYIALSFRDTETHEETCVGIGISAYRSREEEIIEGRFIIPNMSVTRQTFLEKTPAGFVPKPWKQLKEELRRKYKDFTDISTAERFVAEMVAKLSRETVSRFDHKKFLRNFKNAITFSPIKNPTDFVRWYVLEHKPVKMEHFRKSLKNYQFIREKTQRVKKRIDELEKIDKQCNEIINSERNALEYAWVVYSVRFDRKKQEIETLQQDIEKLQQQIDKAIESSKHLETQIELLNQEFIEKKAQLESSDVTMKIKALQAEIKSKQQSLRTVTAAINKVTDVLREASYILDGEQHLPKKIVPILKQAQELSNRLLQNESPDGILVQEGGSPDTMTGQPQGIAPTRTNDIVGAILYGCPLWPRNFRPPVLEGLKNTVLPQADYLKTKLESLVIQENEQHKEAQMLRESISLLEQGDAPLNENTWALIKLLKAHNIQSTPLCDMIDVPEQHERWRVAIESYLGGLREALLVDSERLEEAVKIYRRHYLNFKGCHIINTKQTAKWIERYDSLAKRIETENADAKAYINRIMGELTCVESEAELLKYDQAITADCLLHKSGTITAMYERDAMIGRTQRQKQLEQKRKRLGGVFGSLEETKKVKQEVTELVRLFTRLQYGLSDMTQKPSTLLQTQQNTRQEIQNHQNEIKALAQQQDESGIKSRIAAIEKALRVAKNERAKCQEQDRKATREKAAKDEKLSTLKTEQAKTQSYRDQYASKEGFDLERATKKRDKLKGSTESAEKLRKKNTTRAENLKNSVRDSINEHQIRYHDERLEGEQSHEQLEQYIKNTLKELKDSELAHYEKDAEKALREASISFRAEFVGQLKAGFDEIERHLNELNHHLKTRSFNQEYYSFVKKPNPEFADILELVKSYSREDQANVGGLFDPEQSPNTQHNNAIEKIRQALEEETTHSFEDYRHYYNFEVKMKDEEGRILGSLSHRLKKGSGGENQAPFYVAIGAALAATYLIRKNPDGKLTGGMSLAVFDEAFSKLDVGNTISCLGFMKDLGLQILLAAPDEKHGLLSEMIDTIINVTRDGDALHISPEFPTEKGQAFLSADNPYESI